MAGRSEHEAVLEHVVWPDASLESVRVDYDAVVLCVRESTGKLKTIRCEGYIGYGLCGFWDEVIIEHADVSVEHPSIERCVNSIAQRHGNKWLNSGNEQRNTRMWKALIVYLADGSHAEIVAAKFTVE